MISRRLKTWPGRSASRRRTWNSERVRLTGWPRTVTRWRARSMRTSPASIRLPSGELGAVELAAAQLGAHAAEQLADRERLRHVVVGADLEADDLVDLGVLGGQQDDRHRAAAADVAAEVEAAAPRHHDVEDQQVEAGLLAPRAWRRRRRRRRRASRRSPPARARSRPSRGPRARRRRSGCALVAHHATGVGAGLAIGRLNQKVLPAPTSERPRSRRPSPRPCASRSRGRARSPPSRTRRCRGRSARRRGPAPRAECRFPCR